MKPLDKQVSNFLTGNKPLARGPGSREQLEMIHHHLEAIKAEVARGTKVDPQLVAELESALEHFERGAE